MKITINDNADLGLVNLKDIKVGQFAIIKSVSDNFASINLGKIIFGISDVDDVKHCAIEKDEINIITNPLWNNYKCEIVDAEITLSKVGN